jgi:hypothetical protein
MQTKGSLKPMADVIGFLREGWKITWKQKLVWLFSAFSPATPFFQLARCGSLTPQNYGNPSIHAKAHVGDFAQPRHDDPGRD